MSEQIFTTHNPLPGSQSLICEADGLQHLQQALIQHRIQTISTPEIRQASPQRLELHYIEQSSPGVAQWHQLGQGLAQLHRVTLAQCGYHRDNFIGLSPQSNIWSDNWGTFFVQHRLSFQVNRIQNRHTRHGFIRILEEQGDELAHWLNKHCNAFSLLHGDLWSGNVLFDPRTVWLIDPAVYYGDREVDLAMTEMFGGFAPEFYQSYDQCFPRSAMYPYKRDIYNLYHYLNHYNLFGDGYLSGCYAGFDSISIFLDINKNRF